MFDPTVLQTLLNLRIISGYIIALLGFISSSDGLSWTSAYASWFHLCSHHTFICTLRNVHLDLQMSPDETTLI